MPPALDARDPIYWDRTLEPLWRQGRTSLWRVYCDELHTRLMEEWLGLAQPGGPALKTDLFDEAMGRGLTDALAARGHSVHGLDCSPAVAGQAERTHPGLRCLTADVRHLPYATGAFSLVLSNSTLDHFPESADILTSMKELRRILRPGGRILVTFDNLSNPWMALRNALPYSWLRWTGLVPYYVGASVTAAGLDALLAESGFALERTGTLMHVPRVVALPMTGWVQRWWPAAARPWLQMLFAWERLGGWPTRRRTGHYVVALGRVPAERGGESGG